MSVGPLSASVSALDAYATDTSVIANDVANVGTPWFQDESLVFESLLNIAPGAMSDSQTGVAIGSNDVNDAPGLLIPTGNTMSLATNGSGLFALQGPNGPVFTRAGNFTIDANGQLVDAGTGYPVLGLSGSGALSPIVTPAASTQSIGTGFGATLGPSSNPYFDAIFGGNLNVDYYAAAASGAASASLSTSATIYDSLGNAHAVQITFTPVPPSAGGLNPQTQQVDTPQGVPTDVGSEWQWTVTSTDPAEPLMLSSATGYLFYDPSGSLINSSNDITGQTNIYTGGPVNVSGTQGNVLAVSNWGPDNASTPATIALDFSSSTSLAGASNPVMTAQNGSPSGTLASIGVSSSGNVTATYSNGAQQVGGQIALANFANTDGLQPTGSSAYEMTAASGEPQIGAPGTGTLGSITPGMLEGSNVSLSSDFVKLLESQDAFAANAVVARTGDKDIQDILGLG